MLLAAALPLAPVVSAAVEFCYSDLSDAQYIWGTGKKETYDVAVKVKGESFAGARVVGIRAYCPAQNISNITAWATSELTLDNKQNKPDICSQPTELQQKEITLSFDEPVEVPTEGVYVGYSLTVDALETEGDANPIPVSMGVDPDGFYIHSSRTYLKWRSVSEYIGGATLSLVVLMEGDFGLANVAIGAADEQFAPLDGATWELPVTLVSTGSEPISSLDVEIEVEGSETVTASQEYTTELVPQFGRSFPMTFDLPVNFGPGDHAAKVTVTKVNGLDNAAPGRTAEFVLHALARLVTKRPLVEEYTGLWCNNCPRGYAAMQYMNTNYPDDFVGVAYHGGQGTDNEEMAVIPSKDFPSHVEGFPTAWLDRKLDVDPYYGSGNGFGLPDDWNNLRTEFTPVEITAKASLADGIVSAESSATFMYMTDVDVDIEYILLADGLSNPTWLQRNSYYSKSPDQFSIPEMKAFCKGGEYGQNIVKGLVFDDVAIGTTGRKPLVDSSEIVKDEPIESSCQFVLADAVSGKGFELGTMAEEFRVVAIVIDRADGSVLNCIATEPIANNSSVLSHRTDSAVVATEWYEMQGNRISKQPSGCCIRVDRMQDGTVKATKVVSL